MEITDAAIQELAEVFPLKLKVLNLSGCGKITDAAVAILSKRCLFLKSLELRECRLLTAESMRLLGACTRLEVT